MFMMVHKKMVVSMANGKILKIVVSMANGKILKIVVSLANGRYTSFIPWPRRHTYKLATVCVEIPLLCIES